MSKLTSNTGENFNKRILTNNRDTPFVLCFKYPLEKGYTLSELEKQNIIELQRFLDRISNMSVQQVDVTYGRKPDKNDKYKDLQIYHYEVSQSFRVHVVCESGRYKIIRFDPNHKVHN